MNKAELIERVAEKTGLTRKQADDAWVAFLESITEALRKGEKVQLMGFGTFESKLRRECTVCPPGHGEVCLPARYVPTFRMSKGFKEQLGEPAEE